MVKDYHQCRIPCHHLIWSCGTVTHVHHRDSYRVFGVVNQTVDSRGSTLEYALTGCFLCLCLRFSTRYIRDYTLLIAAVRALRTSVESIEGRITFDQCYLAALVDSCGRRESHADTELTLGICVQAQAGRQVLRHYVADVNGISAMTDDTGFGQRLVAKHTHGCTPPPPSPYPMSLCWC